MNKEQALELLDIWASKGMPFPEHELVIKVPNLKMDEIPSKDDFDNWYWKERTVIEEYTFKYLLCVAYDLTENPKE
jgi:hypothetical protein